jgi:hypothetical protein
MDLGFILYHSHVYKGVSSLLYKTALINHVYHTTLHYSTKRHRSVVTNNAEEILSKRLAVPKLAVISAKYINDFFASG